MLDTIIQYIKSVTLPGVYLGGFVTVLATIFKKAEWGLYLMVILIPQPNIFYKFYDYPFGEDFLDILFIAILIGIFVNKEGLKNRGHFNIILVLILVSYFALWNSSMRYSLGIPLTTSNPILQYWKNYVQMILMYLLALNITNNDKNRKIIIIIMAFTLLVIATRSWRGFIEGSSFSYDRRSVGPFWAIGLGANHFGAFIVHFSAVLLGISLFDKVKWRRWLFLLTVFMCIHPLFFSYSRGAYLAAIAVLLFFGVIKKRSLLLMVIILFVMWQTILPDTVIERINMTETDAGELEHSAAIRLELWHAAMGLFYENPIFGVGFDGSRIAFKGKFKYTDTHNYFMKTLAEQGIIGLMILALIIIKAFISGWRLYMKGMSPFEQGLGIGFAGCVIALVITNMFGDRWSYFVLGSYFWIIWGIVDNINRSLSTVPIENRS